MNQPKLWNQTKRPRTKVSRAKFSWNIAKAVKAAGKEKDRAIFTSA